MKSKDQKRVEAIERGKISFVAKHQYGARRRFDSEDEYLDIFRPKREIVTRQHTTLIMSSMLSVRV